MEKLLILSQTVQDDYTLMEWEKNGIDTGITLRDMPKWLRAVRRVWMRLHLPFESMWYGIWKKELLQYDVILLHGTWVAEGVPAWIHKYAEKHQKKIRVIWWYWNKVVAWDRPHKVQNCEKWSFDRADCERYNMKHNTQYYFNSYRIAENIKQTADVYYLGSDSGRLPFLMSLKKKMESQGLVCDFHIFVSDKRQIIEGEEACFLLKKMDYQDNLNHIGGSRAVLEILREGQSGQTLRSLECLFHKRKLITNDLSLEQAPYYHPNNIFLLGKDELDVLPEFLERPYVEIEDAVVQQYESKAWLERFGIQTTCIH